MQPGDRRGEGARRAGPRKAAAEAVAGQRTAINLGGVDVGDVVARRNVDGAGDLQRDAPHRCRDRSAAVGAAAQTRRARARASRHRGSARPRVDCRGVRKRTIAPGSRSVVRPLRLEAPAVLTRGDRFIIRAYSPPSRLAAASCSTPAPTRPGVRTAEGQAALERCKVASDDCRGGMRWRSSTPRAWRALRTQSLVLARGVAP